jgi:hypothetical protein
MAGLGYKEWVAGEQLTAANFQSYFQDQTVMVFASSAARGSALTGVVSEGMVSYLQDVNQLQVYNGSSWGQVTPDVPNASPGTAGIMFGQTLTLGTNHLKFGYLAGGAGTVTTSFTNGNVAIGFTAGSALSTGHNNVVIGQSTSQLLASGSNNVNVGNVTGFVMNGDHNTAVGFAAGYGWGSSGSNNTLLGALAGGTATFFTYSGSNNVLIGYQASPSATSVSNEITLGNSSISTLRCQVTSITSLSDERDKADIAPLEYGLDFINELEPVSFTWDTRDGSKVGDLDFGFIAQHLAEIEDKYEPDRLKLTLRENEDKLEATPGRLIPILVKAIQELSAKVAELEAKQNG